MAWISIKPVNSGGGRKPTAATAKLYASGILSISHAACELLGNPDRVLVQINPESRRIRLMPTTPDNAGAFSMSGGGNTPHRIGIRSATTSYPELIADYKVTKIAGGIELVPVID